jgi:hypothetical protein
MVFGDISRFSKAFFLGGLVLNIVMLNHCQTRYPFHPTIQDHPPKAEPISVMLMYSPTLQAGGVQATGLSFLKVCLLPPWRFGAKHIVVESLPN